MENTIYGKRSKDSNTRMQLLDQEQAQALTRTSNGTPKELLMFLVPILAIGSILCAVFGIGIHAEGTNKALGLILCVFVAPAQVALLAFLISSKISGSDESIWGAACLSFILSCSLVMIICLLADAQQRNKIENTREELMSEQGYENLEKRGIGTYYAEKDGKEYLLIIDGMKDDGEMKIKVTPFEKGTEEALN